MRHMWRFHHHPRRQLVNLPRTYFEVKDERPRESEGQADSALIFVLKGITIPGELNQSILKFLTGKDLLRVAKVSKTVEQDVRKCKALLFDAAHEQIDDLSAFLEVRDVFRIPPLVCILQIFLSYHA